MAKKSLTSVVFERFNRGGTHKLIMLVIADLSSGRGYADPSIKTIAKMCCVSERQAQYVMKELIESNFILIANNKDGGKAGSTRHYMINISTLTGELFSTRDGCNGLHPTMYTYNRDFQGVKKPPIQGGVVCDFRPRNSLVTKVA